MAFTLQDSRLFDEAQRAGKGPLEREEMPKWEEMGGLIREARRMSVAGWGDGSQNQFVWDLLEENAKTILEKVEQAEAIRTLRGEEALLFPQRVIKRRETTRAHMIDETTLVT
jgi:hypothetical protein